MALQLDFERIKVVCLSSARKVPYEIGSGGMPRIHPGADGGEQCTVSHNFENAGNNIWYYDLNLASATGFLLLASSRIILIPPGRAAKSLI